MGANKRFLQSKFYMEEMNVYEMWKQKVNSESGEIRMAWIIYLGDVLSSGHIGHVGHVGPSVLLTGSMRMVFDVSWCEGY